MKKIIPAGIALLSLGLGACFSQQANPSSTLPDAASSSSMEMVLSSSSVSEATVTADVRYRGMLDKAGISFYQEGTHRLTLDDGRFILLKSQTLDLDSFVGKEVEVFGDEQPTAEAGGTIMNVMQVTAFDASSSSSQESFNMSSESSSAHSLQSSSRQMAAQSSSAEQTFSSAGSSIDADAAKQARIDVMAKYNMDIASWSQQYCSSHIGFCIPVHKNSWYKSYGATTSFLWHVELSNEEIQNMGDGPIAVNLMSGSVESTGASDGQIKVQGDTVTGYRAWTENRHFEISGPASLRTQIEYILKNVTTATPS